MPKPPTVWEERIEELLQAVGEDFGLTKIGFWDVFGGHQKIKKLDSQNPFQLFVKFP